MAVMSENIQKSLESCLQQLNCHFTWNLVEGENSLDDFEDRVFNQNVFQNCEFRATVCNLLAYIKHCRGQNETALECLEQAEKFIQQDHGDKAEVRSLVTWGNYAWVYYHMGQFSEAQRYVDMVKKVCKKYSSPYRIESPEMDSEEGWTRLKCGAKHNEQAKVCFQKALERSPKNPEFFSGLAIASYRLDDRSPKENPIDPLRKAIELNGDNQYIKVLLALQLLKMTSPSQEEEEAARLVEEALEKAAPEATDVLCSAAKFYRAKQSFDKAVELLTKALNHMPNNTHLHYHIASCYKMKIDKVLKMEKSGIDREKEVSELIKKAVYHFKKAESNEKLYRVGSSLMCLCVLSGQYEEAEHYFQNESSKELDPVSKQLLHLRWGNVQLYDMKCEDKAIHHYMEGVRINRASGEREKLKTKLRNIAERRLFKNKKDAKALHILAFLQELNGKKQQAREDADSALGSESLLPSASLDETKNEE
ncbi:interferon-induced protein with tetratricopeptide repeats 2 [Ochotona princeps]|uniref:interferon-induced protein with tetratricopeptide repeats 2 n=1 Tax=Ochotona princeps TaxID=9978 RepID=UPI00271458F0|nr:interferon-induced protein with tetratricopeptide repeats 2 [Ochotona princeps]